MVKYTPCFGKDFVLHRTVATSRPMRVANTDSKCNVCVSHNGNRHIQEAYIDEIKCPKCDSTMTN